MKQFKLDLTILKYRELQKEEKKLVANAGISAQPSNGNLGEEKKLLEGSADYLIRALSRRRENYQAENESVQIINHQK